MNRSTAAMGLGLTIAVMGCGGEPGALPESSEPAHVVVSSPVATRGVVTAPGNVVATEEAELATRMSGTIRRMLVDIGTRVTAGDTLVSLETSDIDARVASARANAQLARQYYDRIESLAEDGAATAQELDEAEARLEMAEAGLRDALAQRGYFVLRAPFAGVITARMADPGDLAVPGQPILEMITTAGLKITADLPAEWAGQLSEGDRIAVHQTETGRRLRAHVTRVVPAVERSSRRFRVEARFEAPDGPPAIPPGTFVRMELSAGATTTRWIPADAVVNRGQLDGVYVIADDSLRLRWIRVGRHIDDAVELLAGPGSDALLVREPSPEFVDGQPVGDVRRADWAPSFLRELTTRGEDVR